MAQGVKTCMMEGMILAAGLGTRLRPLTDTRPKALVEVGGRTLLERAIGRLAEAGVDHVVVNVHHFADMMIRYIAGHEWPCRVTVSDERNLLLDTGGALVHARKLFSGSGPVWVYNVDVLSDFDLKAVEQRHRNEGHLVTLCVSLRPSSRLLGFDTDGMLQGRLPEGTPPSDNALAFSGVSIVSPALFDLLPPDGQPFPVIDHYIALAQAGHRIGSYRHDAAEWMDVGRIETLKKAELWIASSSR